MTHEEPGEETAFKGPFLEKHTIQSTFFIVLLYTITYNFVIFTDFSFINYDIIILEHFSLCVLVMSTVHSAGFGCQHAYQLVFLLLLVIFIFNVDIEVYNRQQKLFVEV